MPSKPTNTEPADSPPDPASARHLARWRIAVIVLLVLLAATASLTKIWNYDIFWHLAAGEWMLQHKAVLRHDPFSSEASQWVNVHWLFQLLVAATHAVGGFVLLSILKCALAVATVLALAWSMRRHVAPGWLLVGGMALLAVMAERIRLRPELVTCLLVMLVIVLVEGVRRGARPVRLWWLVPIMVVWVNVHGLYFFGLGVIWSSVLGAWLDRRLGRAIEPVAPANASPGLLCQRALGPLIAATVACLLTPWPVEAAVHPFILWQRVSGEALVFTYGVAELQPTWGSLGKHPEAVVVVLLLAAVFWANRRRVPIAHVLWLAAFLTIALLARRNVGLIAPVCAYLLTLHGGQWIARIRQSGGWLARLGRPLTWAVAVAAVLGAAAYATERVHRWKDSTERFGPGLLEANYPIGAAKFLRGVEGGGDVLCDNFGDAAVFIYHTAPQHKVWMDGRLEVHSVRRFAEQTRIANDLRTATSAQWCLLPDELRFIAVNHHSSETLSAMMESRRFRLIHVDPAVACFERTDWRGGVGGRAAGGGLAVLAPYDRPMTEAMLVEDYPAQQARWYRCNRLPRTYWMGAMLLWLGRLDSRETASADPLQHECTLLAIRYLTAGRTEAAVPEEISTGMLAWAHQQRALQTPAKPGDGLPLNIHLARALWLYQELDRRDLSTQPRQTFAYRYVHALVQAKRLDAAAEAIADLLQYLPPGQRINPPREYLMLRGTITKAMMSPGATRTGDTIRRLRSAGGGATPEDRRLLGDLLLRRGKPGEARKAYQTLLAGARADEVWQVRLRLALCDWVAGKPFVVDAALAALAGEGRPAVAYYHATLLEQLGLSEKLNAVLQAAVGADGKLPDLLIGLRDRQALRRREAR